jgi:hypothetical protein
MSGTRIPAGWRESAAAFRRERDAEERPRRVRSNGVKIEKAPEKLAQRFELTPFKDIRVETGPLYIVKGLLPRTGLAVVWGEPKCGKSFWTFDLLMHVALEWEYRGRRTTPGPIVYCALEGAQGFKCRIEAFRLEKLAEGAEVDPPFYLMAAPLNLVADNRALVAAIRAQHGGLPPVAVCIDTLNRSLPGSESSDEDMSAYVRAADAIRDAFGCLVVIVHHCGHNGDRPRGHSSLMGALDVQISVRRDGAENIVAEVELAKDGETGLQLVSRLKSVEIGVDEDGEPFTSCVVEAVEAAVGTFRPDRARSLSKGAQTALRALRLAIEGKGEQPPASNHIPAGVRAITVEQWRTYAYQTGISDSTEARARQLAFKRAHEALVGGRHVNAWEEYRWLAN